VLYFLAASSVFLDPIFSDSITPQEKRGKQIYFEGTSPRGEEEIVAYIGEDLTPLPGSAAPCASCHGPDGRGRPEAGVIPSDITWGYLMKPYGHADSMERKHPAFTTETVKDAILYGYDPAGNDLGPSMPLYTMSEDDLEDLIAYMKKLQTDFDPGLSETEIRIGTVLPTRGQMAIIGQGILEVIAAYFEKTNAQGGIYNRRLRLVETSYDNTKESHLSAATSLVSEGDVFAIVSPVVAGAEVEIGELAEDNQVPVIGPLTLFSPDPHVLNDFTFHVYSGLAEQLRALVDFAVEELELDNPRIVVLGPDQKRYRDIQAAIDERCQGHGWGLESAVSFLPESLEASAAIQKLEEEGTDAVFFLGSGELGVWLGEAEKIDWRPYVFLPGAFARKEIFDLPVGFQKKIYLSYPTLISDQTGVGIAEFRSLLEKHEFPTRHRTSQISALASAKILVEGLKGAGRELSREKFLRALEKLYDFHTGLTPPITYGANRRIGALGAHVVTVDLEKKDFVPVGGWVTPK
jgi:ABC-type branched-subunit amino acid transport system substrate-binding protein